MKMDCNFNINNGDYENDTEVFGKRIEIKEKQQCCECNQYFKPTTKMRKEEVFEWNEDEQDYDDKPVQEYYICIDCLSVRNAFFECWVYERIWENLWDRLRDQLPGWMYMTRLTKRARDKICDHLEECWK